MRLWFVFLLAILAVIQPIHPIQAEVSMSNAVQLPNEVPEDVYTGDMMRFPAQWGFHVPKSCIILVTDDELDQIAADPDKVMDLSLGQGPYSTSLRSICETAKASNQRTLIIAFDHFFSQYRPGMGDKPRRLTPDMDEYVEKIAKISRICVLLS